MKKLFYNGTILTLDGENTTARALVVEEGRIREVFVDSPALLQDEKIEKIDLEGKTLMPGFNDNHIHLNFYGDYLNVPNFKGLNEEQILSLLQERYPAPPKGRIIHGYEWDYPGCTNPTKEMLDGVLPHNPVILSQYGGHSYWVNSLTLKKMGVWEKSKDSLDGVVKRHPSGEPTGIIYGMRSNPFILRWIRKRLLSLRENKRNISRALKECQKKGITSVQDNTWSFVSVRAIRRIFKEEKTCRINCWSYGESPLFRFLFNLQRFAPPWYTRGPVKNFIDGTFSSKTAWLLTPYQGTSEEGFGKSYSQILRIAEKEIQKKRQFMFHAIGDKAVQVFLDAIETLYPQYPYIPELRIRLEHAQLIDPKDFPRLKEFGIVLAGQPSGINNPAKDIRLLGEERALRAYPYRSVLDEGIPLSFGSDVPGEDTLNPFQNIHNAVNRKGPQAVTVLDALGCYTRGSAYGEFQEREKGSLEPGKFADFIVLSQNPLEVSKDKIKDIEVEKVYIGGKGLS